MNKFTSLGAVALAACLAMSNSFAGNGTFTIKNDLTSDIVVKTLWKFFPYTFVSPGESREFTDGGGINSILFAFLGLQTSGTVDFSSQAANAAVGAVTITLSGKNKCGEIFDCYNSSAVQIESKPGYSVVQSGTPDKVVVTVSKVSEK